MIVGERIVGPIAMLVGLVALTMAYDNGIAAAPKEFFGERGDLVLMLPSTGRVTSTGTVPLDLAHLLTHRDDVTDVSPEIVVLTSANGRSLLVRGVEVEPFLRIEHAILAEGRLPAAPGEALAGRSIARALGLGIDRPLVVTGSIGQAAVSLTLAGIFEGDTPAVDEILVPLPTAARLAGLKTDAVHLVRIETTNRTGIIELTSSTSPTFTYSDARLTTSAAFTGEVVVLKANLTNWGVIGGAKDVVVHLDGKAAGKSHYRVPPRTTVPVEVPFVVEGVLGPVTVSLNPTFELLVVPPSARLAIPDEGIVEGQEAVFRVTAPDGRPLAGIDIVVGEARATTQQDGTAALTLEVPGPGRVDLWEGSRLIGRPRIFVATPAGAGGAVPRVTSVQPSVALADQRDTVLANITIQNVGARAGSVTANVTYDGAVIGSLEASLASGEKASFEILLPPGAVGRHRIEAEGVSATIEYIDGDPAVELALRARASVRETPALVATVGTAATDYVDRIVGRVAIAATIVSVAAGALALFGGIATWSRYIGERSSSIGLLKALGARRETVVWYATRGALVWCTVAVVGGIAAGIAAAEVLDSTEWVRAFGHTIHPRYDLGSLAWLAAIALLANLVAVRALVSSHYRREADELLQRRTTQSEPKAWMELLREDGA